jgi:hypothetical protein
MLDGQPLAHIVPRLIDRTPENYRIGTRKINVLEGADRKRFFFKRKNECSPFSSMTSISPGSISRTYSASIKSNAQVSDATHHASFNFPRFKRAKSARVAHGDERIGR